MGAPIGNQNGRPHYPRIFSDEIRRQLLADGGKKLRAIVTKLGAMAAKGHVDAARILLERAEGKVPQHFEMSGLDGGPIEITMPKRERARRVAFLLAQGAMAKASESSKAEATHAADAQG